MLILRSTMLLFLIAGIGFAQNPEPIEPDRPDQTESPVTMPRNYFQTESGLSYTREDANTISFTHPSSLFRYGIISGFELRLEAEAKSLRSGGGITCTGIEPISVGFKAHLFDEHGIVPHTSILGSVTLPLAATSIFRGTSYATGFN